MSVSTAPRSFFTRLQRTAASLRFISFSVLLHVLIIIVGGSAVLFQQYIEPPDFVAEGGSLISESVSAEPPPQEMPAQNPTFTPATLEAAAPAISALATTSTVSSFSMNAVPVVSKGLADNGAAAMEAMTKKLGEGAGAGMGRAGGMSGMIFGRKVEAKKLGVILDVSGSAHPHLAEGIKEIEKSFADALLVLTPGCGMAPNTGRSAHEIRKFSSIPKRDLPDDPPDRSTAMQLVKAFRIGEFEQLVRRPALQERLFVSWFEGGDNSGRGSLTNQTQESFDYLMKKGVDSIYWFADFRDPVNAQVTDDLLKDLKRKKIKVYLHNFAGGRIGPEATLLSEGTGVSSEPRKAM